MKEIKLTGHDGSLCIPQEDYDRGFLLYYSPADPGYTDTIDWPDPNGEKLISALYDARQMGLIPEDTIVRLPDGSIVDF